MSFYQVLAGIFGGFKITAIVSALALLYAVPFSLVFGILQHFAKGSVRIFITGLIEFWRSSPVIVLLYAFYYSFPAVGINLSAITVGAMVLGLNTGGYGSQSVRAALQALDHGQLEAGLAIGLTRFDVLRFIELPQAITRMIPTFINQAIQLIKGTALVSLITLTDMTFRAKEIAQVQYNPVAIYSGLLLAYFIVCYPVTIMGRRIEIAFGKSRQAIYEL
ncbi:putative amino acid permease (plasmid) [Cupriavidus taiwanensis]|uniref:Amino acid permease n=1 Tax=Cupriavidus taiwanensis TaxID=164546 RepID=A0A375HC79_9BURK|nr:amino acid ABC transporter permease [Cupriavidus taiwanensis]SOZ71417.1 putative amino acid permease [Cupriavidus taiwanensis]SOZ72476.1 putative amino acid permease [Cupriavidus taiwanensis]SOZ74903.1 putative amino acid permease [Cupriavidus taiwanensis]SPA03342.1 putative amino acid permease [Cupriavidus taiwanensis]SPA11706.1 putative amino acid permease [Cupriavidus taiwanensis]